MGDVMRNPLVVGARYLLLLSVVSIVWTGCFPKQSLSVAPIDTEQTAELPGVSGEPPYEDAWEALFHMDVEGFRASIGNAEQHLFASGLEFLITGDLESAERIFRQSLSVGDQEARILTVELLHISLFTQSRWSDLLEFMNQENESAWDDTSAVMARAFASVPNERFVFPSAPVTLPTTFSDRGFPVVDVAIGGHTWHFLVDTGASVTALVDDVAELSKAQILGTESGIINDTISFRPALVDRVSVGRLTIENHPVIVISRDDLNGRLLPAPNAVQLDGIVGWPIIRNVVLEIDYSKGETTILKPELRHDVTRRNMFELKGPLVVLESPGAAAPLYFLLDTAGQVSYATIWAQSKLRLGDDVRRGLQLRLGDRKSVV